MAIFQKGKAPLYSLLLATTVLYPIGQAESAGNGEGAVNQNYINVREGPDISYAVIDTLPLEMEFIIVDQKKEWVKIRTAAGNEGWVAKWLTTAEAIVTATINVRTHASLQGNVLGKITKGSKVKIVASEGNWAKIIYHTAYGWIHKDYITLSGSPIKSKNGNEEVSEPPQRKSSNKKPIAAGKENSIDEDLSPRSAVNQLPVKGEAVIKQNGTNIRTRPDVRALIVTRTFIGDRFQIIGSENNWYKIRLESGATGYVASWVVSVSGNVPRVKREGAKQYLSDKMIVIDPGHGGKDQGTKGVQGTQEKNLTLKTALLLKDKLEAAGAAVVLTRSSDYYVSLPARVKVSHFHNADAFISLHYDHAKNHMVSGVTTYYYHDYQKSLAASISRSLGSSLQVINRGYRYGDYHVVRENEKAAVLLELGYLSNEAEESKLKSRQYLINVSTTIYEGLLDYFK
ncbi:N-acetylmuramoyl-L-alanine amidase [Bacillus sp. V5-8f]|uniref:N-acetylmuramoyl-L-alanine amidase n=1 Tax=Bacillus sp. V5-8f TaxID=2053044 RepID=UPI000C791A57|nr:N-acetylmuramoyl-L-alanine amidase [Bacillus sp. V5-8f]PLT34587.1 hypothetical protein CUU64_04015 [Bacillus sp. V5-8f]